MQEMKNKRAVRNTENKQQSDKEVSLYLSATTLNVNILNTLIRRHRLTERIKPCDPNYMPSLKDSLSSKIQTY